jgi:hypothetical protein
MLIYTFRTNKNIEYFLKLAGLSLDFPVFVINKPSEDIPKLLSLINQNQPDWVIGFASTGNQSRWEQAVTNRFGSGRVSKKLVVGAEFKLSRPEFLGGLSEIKTGKGMSASFCNQAAFRVQEFIKLNELNVQSGFLHLKS